MDSSETVMKNYSKRYREKINQVSRGDRNGDGESKYGAKVGVRYGRGSVDESADTVATIVNFGSTRESLLVNTEKDSDAITTEAENLATVTAETRTESSASINHVTRKHIGQDMRDIYNRKPLIYKILKRFFDIISSGLGLVILSPVFLFTAIAIKLEDGGPVIFSGQRYGKDLKYFPMHKFRSMCVDAESRTAEVIGEADKNGMAFKIKDDPRITRIGKFIRKTSIDELPQLWNVFVGQMSVVGPRPIQTTVDEGDSYDMQRWVVKPGLTCTWQVSGRAEVPWDEWVEMDLDYIENMGVVEDLKLFFKTFGALFKMVGAH